MKKSVEREIVEAHQAGATSWKQDKQPAQNPWAGDAATARERVLARAWRAGRTAAVPKVLRGAADA